VSDDGPSPKQVAEALANLGDSFWALIRFAQTPFKFVFSIISAYIVATVIGFGQYIVGSVLLVFDTVAGYFRSAAILLVASLQIATDPVLVAGRLITIQIARVVVAAGPLGPPIAAALTALLLYGTYRLLIAVAGEFPVGSTLVDFLGLR